MTLFTDDNGDKLTLSFVKAADETTMNKYGIYFNTAQNVFTGKPELTGTIGLVKMRATDVHGAYADAYITIKISDYRVKRRPNGGFNGFFHDITISEGRDFVIALNDNIFYDATDSYPLVFFISDLADVAPPSWLKFNPVSNTISGTAPFIGNTTLSIRVRAMNVHSHDSTST